MRYLDSNMPSKIFFFALAGAKILRTVTAKNDLINPMTSVKTFLIRMKKQGCECIRILSLIKKVFGKHFWETSLQIGLLNLLSSFVCNYCNMWVCVRIF